MSDGISTAETPEFSKLEKKRCGFPLWLLWIGALILPAGIFGGNALIQNNQAERAMQTAIALAATETQSLAQTGTARPTETATATITTIPTQTSTPTAAYAAGTIHISDVDGMELVFVPNGTFLMGSSSADRNADSDEYPQHEVHLDSYWIDKTEVTNAMYAAFLNDHGNQSEGGYTWLAAGDQDACIGQVDGIWQPDSGYGEHPVVEVSWYGAAAYCDWAGRRLPTEAEWEKAARGTERPFYPWGYADPTCNLAHYSACEDRTVPVGSYPSGASPYGALDMAGNVWEWVADWYDSDYYDNSPTSNPTGPAEGDRRVLRGGSWYPNLSYLRSANRNWLSPVNAWYNLGFRCARLQ